MLIEVTVIGTLSELWAVYQRYVGLLGYSTAGISLVLELLMVLVIVKLGSGLMILGEPPRPIAASWAAKKSATVTSANAPICLTVLTRLFTLTFNVP